MISSHIPQQQVAPPSVPQQTRTHRSVPQKLRGLTWLCLLLACIGTSWFAFQVFLAPQPREFTADWQDARWVQAPDNTGPVAYFRSTVQLYTVPQSAFVTVAANQVFQLYVNGVFIGSNMADFALTGKQQSYLYDVDASLLAGTNVIGLRVANLDQATPQLRATFGVLWGKQVQAYSTGTSGWQATGQTALVYPRPVNNHQAPALRGAVVPAPAPLPDPHTWAKSSFDASRWPNPQLVTPPPATPHLLINPQIYEQPLPSHWLSAGLGQESYYVRQFSMPAGFDNALLRILATGAAQVFINDHQYIDWNGQAAVPMENVINYLGDNTLPSEYRNGLVTGIYDISPYLHPGMNTIAIHVLAPGTTTEKVGTETQKSALSVDMLVAANGSNSNPIADDRPWHVSTQPAPGWAHESAAATQWPVPQQIYPPGESRSFYLPNSNTPRNQQLIPPVLIAETIAWSTLAVLALWLAFALLVLLRYCPSRRAALEASCLLWLPALALEALLAVLAFEPQLPQPFPYTPQWGLALLAVVAVSALSLWLYAKQAALQQLSSSQKTVPLHGLADEDDTQPDLRAYKAWHYDDDDTQPVFPVHQGKLRPEHGRHTFGQQALSWLKHNWAILPLLLLAIPLACYNLAYEPYWQDELSSYLAARNIMAHGIPAFPSGFLYPKAELFSYLLALLMSIFGTTSLVVPRTISVTEYLLSIPLIYIVGSRFFNRKVGWLAAAMVTLSPYAMVWSRQTRMYEQAQLMVIVVLAACYWALQRRNKSYPVYLAVFSLLIAYFSHEEVFIVLPAVVICMLLGSREGPYGIPAVLRKKHWWIATVIAVGVIALQLSLMAHGQPAGTHIPDFATDQSKRPQIQLTTNNVPYYFDLLFMPKAIKDGLAHWSSIQPVLTLDSLLALLGCVLAFVLKDRRARYCALFLIISTLTLTFVFTMQADRYYYPLLPVYYLLASYAFWKIITTLWHFAQPALLRLHPHNQFTYNQPSTRHENTSPYSPLYCRGPMYRARLPLPLRVAIAATLSCLCAAVLILPMLPLSDYNLFVSRITGLTYHRHYSDYDNAAGYVRANMQQGDIVISVGPAETILYYVGQVDHYFSADRALFVFERNGRLIETASGAHPLLNQADFQTVLSQHTRIWLISDNGVYEHSETKNARFIFPPPDFRMVYEGYGSSVYFRNAN